MKNKRNRWVWIAFILIFIAMVGLKLFSEKQQQKISGYSLKTVHQTLKDN